MMIPTSAAARAPLWVNASYKLGRGTGGLATTLAIQDLGRVEVRLLEIEEQLPAIIVRQQQRPSGSPLVPEDLLLSEAQALSRLWLFGLYESVRIYKKTVNGQETAWRPFKALWHTLNVVRAPLAKQQVTGQTTSHVPATIVQPTTGRVGWRVFDPKAKAFQDVLRIDLADQFLLAAGTLAGAGEAEAQQRQTHAG